MGRDAFFLHEIPASHQSNFQLQHDVLRQRAEYVQLYQLMYFPEPQDGSSHGMGATKLKKIEATMPERGSFVFEIFPCIGVSLDENEIHAGSDPVSSLYRTNFVLYLSQARKKKLK